MTNSLGCISFQIDPTHLFLMLLGLVRTNNIIIQDTYMLLLSNYAAPPSPRLFLINLFRR